MTANEENLRNDNAVMSNSGILPVRRQQASLAEPREIHALLLPSQTFKQPPAFSCLGLDHGPKCLADRNRIIRIGLLLMIEVLYARHLSPQFSPNQENAGGCWNVYTQPTRARGPQIRLSLICT